MKTQKQLISKIVAAVAVLLTAVWMQSAQATLIGYWRFDSTSNRGLDASGNGRDVAFPPAPVPTFGPGIIGDAMANHDFGFRYARDPVTNSVFDFGSSDFTIQAWANFDTTTGAAVFIEKFTAPAGPGWTFYKTASQAVEFYGQGVGPISMTSNLVISASVWHQFAVTRSGSAFTLYFDGAQVGTGSSAGAITSSTQPLEISGRQAGDNFVYGLEDEVAIWNSALSSGGIAALWNGGLGASAIPEPSTFVLFGLGGLLLRRRMQRS